MFAAPHETIAAAVVSALSSHGPLSEDELSDVLAGDGIDLGSDRKDLLAGILDEHPGPVLPLADGRWVWLPSLLGGRVFTHRLSAAEAEYDLVFVDADLTPLAMLTEMPTYQHLTDGSPVADVSPLVDGDVLAERGVPDGVVPDDGALVFGPGRFAALGVSAGDLLGLRVLPDGLELAPVDDVATSEIAVMIDALLEQVPGDPIDLNDGVWTLCTTHDELFREPSVPLSESLSAGGLAHQGDWVARSGFDFSAWHAQRRIDSIRSRYQLSEDEALAVLAALRLYNQVREVMDFVMDAAEDGDLSETASRMEQLPWMADPADDNSRPGPQQSTREHRTVGMILEFLAEPAVADAVRIETVSADRRAAEALGLFAESVESMAPRPARPALRWLRAVAQERLGEVEQAETTFNAAESLDPSWPLTLVWLARYASDRGDAERGLALLRRAGTPPDHALVQLLEHFQSTPRSDLGRNQPCWCGSGRKYKVCHLHREQLPLAERAAWLYQKAAAHLFEGSAFAQLMKAAEARSEHWDTPDGISRALDDAIVTDAVLFEGGTFAEFLSTRGPLLPGDERLLAGQWLLVDRSVHEVVSVRRNHGMTMRDVRTGDVHDVRERTASNQVKSGQLYCARVVPVGDTMQIFGGMEPVSIGERDALIALLDDEPDPVELVDFLSRRFAPPELRNTEGESLMVCEATVRVADPVAVSEALDEEYDRRDDLPDEGPGWFEHVITDGMERIRASIELDGDELHIHANSQARFARVLATIRGLDPSATVLAQTREPAGDLTSVQRLAPRGLAASSGILDPAADPALAATLEEMTGRYEQAWLDETIPALAGRTPRQCADDPTRRPDLIALLDSFPENHGRPGMMSPTRLRSALGLS